MDMTRNIFLHQPQPVVGYRYMGDLITAYSFRADLPLRIVTTNEGLTQRGYRVESVKNIYVVLI